MNAFEEIIAGLLRHQGYWTHMDYKVNLTKAKKVELGKPSMPRPEIDILAYHVGKNELLWVECKSYLDSGGVHATSFLTKGDRSASRYKVFTWEDYRRIVTEELIKQVVSDGLVLPNPQVIYCLVAGRTATETDRHSIKEHFTQNGWLFYDEKWIHARLNELSQIGYEDDVSVIVAKLAVKMGEI